MTSKVMNVCVFLIFNAQTVDNKAYMGYNPHSMIFKEKYFGYIL